MLEKKNDLQIRIQQEKSYEKDGLFFLEFEKVLKMQASVIDQNYAFGAFKFFLAKIGPVHEKKVI